MPKVIDHYLKLRRAIQDWILGADSILPIADELNLTATSCKELLIWNGLADVTGRAEEDIVPQDVFNLIFLYWGQSHSAKLRKMGM